MKEGAESFMPPFNLQLAIHVRPSSPPPVSWLIPRLFYLGPADNFANFNCMV